MGNAQQIGVNPNEQISHLLRNALEIGSRSFFQKVRGPLIHECWGHPTSCRLVDAYKVDQHDLWKDGRIINRDCLANLRLWPCSATGRRDDRKARVFLPAVYAGRLYHSRPNTMHDAGLSADIFHDIDLAARRPANFTKVFTEHPNRWPDSLPERDLYAGFYHSIRKRKSSARKQTGRGKTTL